MSVHNSFVFLQHIPTSSLVYKYWKRSHFCSNISFLLASPDSIQTLFIQFHLLHVNISIIYTHHATFSIPSFTSYDITHSSTPYYRIHHFSSRSFIICSFPYTSFLLNYTLYIPHQNTIFISTLTSNSSVSIF